LLYLLQGAGSIGSYENNDLNKTILISNEVIDNDLILTLNNEYRGTFRITIYDVMGSTKYISIYEKNNRESVLSVNLNNFSNGIYFIRYIFDDNEFLIKSFLK
jgi:hypothetical protein